jgi:predicted Zn-dependent protease
VISHSVLTNHRILAQAEESFPDIAFHMTNPQLPDLVHLSANPARQAPPPLLVQLQAYAQVILTHPDYRARYWSVAQQLKTTHADNVYVLEALADEALQRHNAEGSSLAIRYLQDAIHRGATNPPDFEELAGLLVAAKRQAEAVDVLRKGMLLVPYDAELYRLSAKVYFGLNEVKEACEVAAVGVQKFPQDDEFRTLRNRCDTTSGGMNN